MIRPNAPIQSPTTTPKCLVCTTPKRCGSTALHTQGPRCVGKADGMDDCDCLNECGDDPWIETGRSMSCEHRRETQARIAALPQAAPTAPSPTAGMNIAQRILHVGGRNNAAGYVEFGSIQAVEALVRQVLRDLPTALQLPAMGLEPFGYVNTHTGQFFREVEQSRKNNQGHWRTVYTATDPADAEGLQ